MTFAVARESCNEKRHCALERFSGRAKSEAIGKSFPGNGKGLFAGTVFSTEIGSPKTRTREKAFSVPRKTFPEAILKRRHVCTPR